MKSCKVPQHKYNMNQADFFSITFHSSFLESRKNALRKVTFYFILLPPGTLEHISLSQLFSSLVYLCLYRTVGLFRTRSGPMSTTDFNSTMCTTLKLSKPHIFSPFWLFLQYWQSFTPLIMDTVLILTRRLLQVQELVIHIEPNLSKGRSVLGCTCRWLSGLSRAAQMIWLQDNLSQLVVREEPAGSSHLVPAVALPLFWRAMRSSCTNII